MASASRFGGWRNGDAFDMMMGVVTIHFSGRGVAGRIPGETYPTLLEAQAQVARLRAAAEDDVTFRLEQYGRWALCPCGCGDQL